MTRLAISVIVAHDRSIFERRRVCARSCPERDKATLNYTTAKSPLLSVIVRIVRLATRALSRTASRNFGAHVASVTNIPLCAYFLAWPHKRATKKGGRSMIGVINGVIAWNS